MQAHQSWNEREQVLIRQRDEADRASRDMMAFVARVSHELRTPLHALMGYTELICTSSDDSSELLPLVQEQAASLVCLVDDLLDLSALESGEVQLKHAPCDVRAMVEGVVQTVQAANRVTDLVLSTRFVAETPLTILTDEGRLRQILTNLVSNAVKYTPTGLVEVSVDVAGSLLRFRVADSGPGIPSDELSHIFDPFKNVGTPLVRGGASTGLGLAIVKKLVEKLGGTIGVESVLGLGSMFHVVLPWIDGGVPDRLVAKDVEPVGRTARVLVVDDSPTNLRLVEHQLRALGHVAVVALSADAALQAMHPDIDVVLMDLNMPVKDGFEATKGIRAAGWTTPILALTAAAMASDRVACREAGMDGFLSKPIGLDGLARAIAQHTKASSRTPGPPVPPRPVDPLAELTDQLGNAAVADLLGIFVEEYASRTSSLLHAMETKHEEDFRRHAHTLASNSQLLGGLKLSSLCATAEARGLAIADQDFRATLFAEIVEFRAIAAARLAKLRTELTSPHQQSKPLLDIDLTMHSFPERI